MKIVTLRIKTELEGADIILFWMHFYGQEESSSMYTHTDKGDK